jgi:molybdopterin-guanine dinucleotide biosynthesis protein A
MTRYGFVQAGGGSTRFGTDKGLVQFAGKTMLQRTAGLLASVCDEVSVVAPPGKYANLQWPIIADRWPGEGPLGGILTALLHIRERELLHESRATDHRSRSLIVSCDMPFQTQEFLAFLWERAALSVAQVIVPESESGLEPLCACWRADAVTAVQGAFDAGVRKVTEAMKHISIEVLDESAWTRFDTDNRLFWNMNTPEDYEEARRILEMEIHE